MIPLLLPLLACDGADPAATDPTPSVDDSGGDSGGEDTGETGETGDTGETGAPGDARAVILFIGDGMGFEHVAGGGLYAYGAAGTLVMETLPYEGRLRTASLSGITDSAAAATALATGVKTWNNVVGLDRDQAAVTNLVELARSRGMAVGVLTNDALSGATPASFTAHVENRGDGNAITEQQVAQLPDVMLGGGRASFDPYLDALSANLVEDRDALLAATPDGRPLLGLFDEGTLPYVTETREEVPSLAEMTSVALQWLDDDPDGFFLVVEGARIDHASHSNATDDVHPETAAFDQAVAEAVAWAGERDATILVTADHECGGLAVQSGTPAGTIPTSSWRWGQHTNADVPVYASGSVAAVLDGQRVDNVWVHAVLSAAIEGAAVVEPTVPPVIDGSTEDLGTAVTTQTHPTTFGPGFNQLDALRLTADADGIRIGVDGVFERGDNAVLVLVDLDFGESTGAGRGDVVLADEDGVLDTLLTRAAYTPAVDGLGFDLVVASVGAEEVTYGQLSDVGGLRGLTGSWGYVDDFWWLVGVTNFDDGNVAEGVAADDAGETGATANGFEALVPWATVYPSGPPSTGTRVAVAAVLVNGDGTWASNQALPPLASAAEPGASEVPIASVVTLEVGADGVAMGPAAVHP